MLETLIIAASLNTITTEVEIRPIDPISINFAYETTMQWENGYTRGFDPSEMIFKIGAEYKVNENLSLGFKHSCKHDIDTNKPWDDSYIPIDMVYIKIK